jgi:hypothetical protein
VYYVQLTIRWRQIGIAGRVKADILLPLCDSSQEMPKLLDTLFSTLASLEVSSTEASCFGEEQAG